MIAIKYSLFALISSLINLIFQYCSLLMYSKSMSLYVAMFFGTLTGLVTKYILDKKYIFNHITKKRTDDAKIFLLYSLMGLMTTSIFWIFEIAFDYFLSNSNAKYFGAIIGLSIGYVVKYFLDKRFVFIELMDAR